MMGLSKASGGPWNTLYGLYEFQCQAGTENGASMEDISAGLMSVVKMHCIRSCQKSDDIGKQIVVQGGTFLNDTVLRSFERSREETSFVQVFPI
ncbi:MAG: hypothetical protein ACLTJG_02235 [[Clostridium] innocuum]